jgi:uncharacterized protein (TIGR02996 family)
MDAHAAFLAEIRERPGDDVPRLIYADWLEEQGGRENEARAAFVRFEAELAGMPGNAGGRWPKMQHRLRELAAAVDPEWLAAVARSRIENCGLAFLFRCPKRWDRMRPTDDVRVRSCDGCHRNVHYCDTVTEANRHAVAGRCVAIAPAVQRADGDLLRPAPNPGQLLLGFPAPPERPGPTSTPPGERVVILDGTFAGMDGRVARVDPRTGHVFVALTIFGRPVRVELEPSQVELAR